MSRGRRIVKLAASKTELPSIARILTNDPRGAYEKDAARLVRESANRAAELGLSESDVNDQIATLLLLRVLTAEKNAAIRDGIGQ